MKIDFDLIRDAPNYLNPLKQRELNLRNNKIPAIENLILTKASVYFLYSHLLFVACKKLFNHASRIKTIPSTCPIMISED